MPSTQNAQANDDKISHYQLKKLLVAQTASAIYLAEDEQWQKDVFLVTLQPEAVESADLAERFKRRVETLAQLDHEIIPALLDHGIDRSKRPYAIMAYQPGQFLAEQLANRAAASPDDTTQIVAALTLVKQLASGLAVSHPSGLIHHDLRPENIYLTEAGQPLLLDLAVPPTPPAAAPIEAGPVQELDYHSPEQLHGKALSGRSNIYSLGILLYRLLAGHKPMLPLSEWDIFEHKGTVREVPLKDVCPGLTPETYQAVQDSMWQKEWSRFDTAEAQTSALEQAIEAELAPPPPPPPAWILFLNRLRQPKTLKIVIPVVVLLLLLLLVLLFIQGRANRQRSATPIPDSALSPAETETFAAPESDSEEDIVVILDPTRTPTITNEVTGEVNFGAGEVLPPAEKAATAVSPPSATAVPSTPTQLPPTSTALPSPTIQVTETPTAEEAQISCVPSRPAGWVRYEIQPNDSLSVLAAAANTTVEQLQQANCLDTTLLSIGQEIWRPASLP